MNSEYILHINNNNNNNTFKKPKKSVSYYGSTLRVSNSSIVMEIQEPQCCRSEFSDICSKTSLVHSGVGLWICQNMKWVKKYGMYYWNAKASHDDFVIPCNSNRIHQKIANIQVIFILCTILKRFRLLPHISASWGLFWKSAQRS